MRGSHIFQSLFDLPAVPPKMAGKGRDAELNTRRNELLLNRYYFYGKYTPNRYDLIIRMLSDEFFLTERRVQDIIQEHNELLRDMRKTPPTVQQLRKRWPHLVWQAA